MSDTDKNYLEDWLGTFGEKLDKVLQKIDDHENRIKTMELEAPHCKAEQVKEIAGLKSAVSEIKGTTEKKWERFWKNVGRVVLGAAGLGVVGGLLFGLVYFLDAIKKLGLVKP